MKSFAYAFLRGVFLFAFAVSAILFTASVVRADDTYASLLGNWTCTSDAGSRITQANALTRDGQWLSMRVDWSNPRQVEPGYFQNFFFHSTDRDRSADL